MRKVLIEGKPAIVRTDDIKILDAKEDESIDIGNGIDVVRDGGLKIICMLEDVKHFVGFLKGVRKKHANKVEKLDEAREKRLEALAQ